MTSEDEMTEEKYQSGITGPLYLRIWGPAVFLFRGLVGPLLFAAWSLSSL
jgi:hypothetical protein